MHILSFDRQQEISFYFVFVTACSLQSSVDAAHTYLSMS